MKHYYHAEWKDMSMTRDCVHGQIPFSYFLNRETIAFELNVIDVSKKILISETFI